MSNLKIVSELLVVVLTVILFTAPAHAGSPRTKPLSDFELGKFQYCGTDVDCVKSVNGCCDCANGGVDVAVSKIHLENFRAKFDCLRVQCGNRERIPVCGSGVVACQKHKCTYVELNEFPKVKK